MVVFFYTTTLKINIMKIQVITETDKWNSNPLLIGVFLSKRKAINEATRLIIDREGEMSEQTEMFLMLNNQTQGLDTNYSIEEKETNEIFN